MAEERTQAAEELSLTPERAAIVEPAVRALLADLRTLDNWETVLLEPVTNAKRWWLDDDTE